MYGRKLSAKATAAHNFIVPVRQRSEVPLDKEKRREPPLIDTDPAAPIIWYGIVTAPGQENKAEEELRKLGFTCCYIPRETYWTTHRAGKRVTKRERQKPLIPRYLFLAFEPGDTWYGVKEAEGVSGVLSNHGTACPIPAKAIAKLADRERGGWFDERKRRALETGTEAPYAAGDQIRIIGENAFHSFPATVENCDATTVELLVAIFGRMTPMALPIDQVELTHTAEELRRIAGRQR